MNKAYLLAGSNIGDSRKTILAAEKNIEESVGKIICRSSFYQTAAWGNEDQPDFLNRVMIAETALTAEQTLKNILAIESAMGRKRSVKNAPRTIDLDILFFNDEIISSANLIVPHPEIQNRRFVLAPLAEIIPSFIHPALQLTITTLLMKCADKLNVQKI